MYSSLPRSFASTEISLSRNRFPQHQLPSARIIASCAAAEQSLAGGWRQSGTAQVPGPGGRWQQGLGGVPTRPPRSQAAVRLHPAAQSWGAAALTWLLAQWLWNLVLPPRYTLPLSEELRALRVAQPCAAWWWCLGGLSGAGGWAAGPAHGASRAGDSCCLRTCWMRGLWGNWGRWDISDPGAAVGKRCPREGPMTAQAQQWTPGPGGLGPRGGGWAALPSACLSPPTPRKAAPPLRAHTLPSSLVWAGVTFVPALKGVRGRIRMLWVKATADKCSCGGRGVTSPARQLADASAGNATGTSAKSVQQRGDAEEKGAAKAISLILS